MLSLLAWCNVASTRFAQLQKFENRISRLFSLNLQCNLVDFCEKIGFRLAEKSKDIHHPLHTIFDSSANRYSARRGKTYRKLFSKTKRFQDSFIRFA